MDKNKDRIAPIAYLAIVALGLLNSVVYSIPYIKDVFYEGMIELTGATNSQLGLLMTIYGLGEVISLPIGGVLAEKADSKKVLAISTILTAVGCFVLAIAPSYAMTAIVWLGLIFTSLFMFWGSLFKALRLLGSSRVQGKIVGYYQGAAGAGYFIINMILLKVYDMNDAAGAAAGMKAVFLVLGILCVAIALFGYVAIKIAGNAIDFSIIDDTKAGSEENELLIETVKACVKNKTVWFFGIVVFSVYAVKITIGYFTPYFQDVLGVAAVSTGVIAVIRVYGTQMLGAPLGGIWADKMNSTAKTVGILGLISLICLVTTLVLPEHLVTVGVVTAISTIAAFAITTAYGIQFAIIPEGYVPAKYMATAIGLSTAIGYIPDVFQHALYGMWLDKYGNTGYTYMFIYGSFFALVAVVTTMLFLKYKKSLKEKMDAA